MGVLLEFREHHPANAFAAEIPCNHNFVDLHGIGRDPHRENRDQLAHQFPEQTTCRNCRLVSFGLEKCLNGLVVGSFNGANEKVLSFHGIDDTSLAVMLLQHTKLAK